MLPFFNPVSSCSTSRTKREISHLGSHQYILSDRWHLYTDCKVAIVFLCSMWGMVIIGSILKVFFTGKYDRLSTALYLSLGWMVIFLIKPLRANMPFDIFLWILGGGISYTFGIIFYKWERLQFQHSIWHLFVLAGTLLQFVGVYKCIGQTISIK